MRMYSPWSVCGWQWRILAGEQPAWPLGNHHSYSPGKPQCYGLIHGNR
jgi:hypothetical protein